MNRCEKCDKPIASTGEIDRGRLVYACDNGHPTMMVAESKVSETIKTPIRYSLGQIIDGDGKLLGVLRSSASDTEYPSAGRFGHQIATAINENADLKRENGDLRAALAGLVEAGNLRHGALHTLPMRLALLEAERVLAAKALPGRSVF